MYGRPLCSDDEAMDRGFRGPECARRRRVLQETLARFEDQDGLQQGFFHRIADINLLRWRKNRVAPPSKLCVEVHKGDWGVVTQSLTLKYGECFAALNMANAYYPGGGYVEGASAQEENMFRRTDCHFRIDYRQYDRDLDRYRPEMTRLISAEDGVVYLDTLRPRVCIRGPEDRGREDLGYDWLPENEIFPFFELCAAAQDLYHPSEFDPVEGRKRIAAQLDTLRYQGVRHAVLGASGCGAFRNPADLVAEIYREEIDKRAVDFSVIAFAIFSAGYGPDNYTPFAEMFSQA